MDDKARLFNLDDQTPVNQLIISFLIVVLAGSIFFLIFLFAGSFFFSTDASSMLSIPGADAGIREISILKYVQASQHIALFVLPVIIITFLMRKGNISFLKTDRMPGYPQVIMVILLAITILPLTTYTGILNSRMDLPGWLSGVEEWMKMKEDTAGDLTGLLIQSSGAGGLIINIIVLAALPALGEEMLFRGVLQQILSRVFRSGYAGIWITAIIFSTIHLQFYGFLPRLILGLIFGYTFFWSGNLWIAVLAHFINNAIPVFISSFMGWKELGDKASELTEKQALLPLVPVIVSFGILYYFWSGWKMRLVNQINK